MEIELLNSAFGRAHVVDAFKSLIWSDRYWLCGDFDLRLGLTDGIIANLGAIKYARLKESQHLMMLETFNIATDIEDGAELLLKGRSLESILNRRVIGSATVIDGNLQTGIQGLLNDHIISPTDSNRQITNFEFQASTDPLVTVLTLNTQFLGENLYKAISDICIANEIGFRILLTTAGNFRFELYAGVDRSYEQSTNQEVVFSPDFDNLINGSYIESSYLEKSHAYVSGEEGVGNTRTLVIVAASGTPPTGLSRREMYFEANIMRNTPGGELSEAEYIDQLTARGAEELTKKPYVKAFDGEADTTMYNFGDEYSMGDIVQISDGYGHSTQSRVTEMIYSHDREGIKMYPTFTTIEE